MGHGFVRIFYVFADIAYAQQGTAIGRMVDGLLLIFDVLIPEEMAGWVEFL